MKNLMQIISDVPALKGTFIEDLFQIMQNGQFNEPDIPIDDDEKIVGEMNEPEKALSTLFEKYAETVRKITARLSGEAEPFSSEEMPKLKAELESCRKRLEIARKLMWENIETRLASQKTPLATSWGIRYGYQIVLMFGERDRGPIRSLLGLALLESMMRD